MNYDKSTIALAIILQTILGIGYLAYSACLLNLALTACSGWMSGILILISTFLFIYVLSSVGGFAGIVPRIGNTGINKD